MRGRSVNQRDFYRVDSRAIVSHCVLGDHIPAGRSAESYFGDSDHFSLVRELRRLDQESAHLLHVISEQDRNLGSFLHSLNRKIDTIARHMAALSPDLKNGAEQTVSISEGGLAFGLAEPPALGTVLVLRVTLLPSCTALVSFASVVKLVPEDNGDTQVSVNFERLQEAERQVIARHVMQVQMAEQRRKSGRDQ